MTKNQKRLTPNQSLEYIREIGGDEHAYLYETKVLKKKSIVINENTWYKLIRVRDKINLRDCKGFKRLKSMDQLITYLCEIYDKKGGR